MRICITIKKFQIRKSRSLTISKIDRILIKSHRYHAGSEDYHVNIDSNIFSKQGICRCDAKLVSICLHLHNRRFSHENAIIELSILVVKFHVTGSSHMLIQNICFTICIIIADILGLLECYHRSDGVTVRKIIIIILPPRTLYESNIRRNLAIFCKLFKFSIGDDIFQGSISKMFVLRYIGRVPSGCKNN